MISDFKSHIQTHGYFFYRMYYDQFSSLITQVMQLFSAIIRYLQESLKKAKMIVLFECLQTRFKLLMKNLA